jgi:Beta/Gamma crystallin
MNFKAIITVGLATLSATLVLTDLSAQAQLKPKRILNRDSPGVVKDVTLFSKSINRGQSFESNKGVADLQAVGFDNRAAAIQVNNGQKWRFYKDKNFQGEFIEIGPNEGRGNLGKFTRQISSFKSVK